MGTAFYDDITIYDQQERRMKPRAQARSMLSAAFHKPGGRPRASNRTA